jgi:hypothetical protein
MYEQPELSKWGIFYEERDKRTASMFLETMGQCFEQFRYNVSKPREFAVRSNNFRDWEKMIRDNLNPQV